MKNQNTVLILVVQKDQVITLKNEYNQANNAQISLQRENLEKKRKIDFLEAELFEFKEKFYKIYARCAFSKLTTGYKIISLPLILSFLESEFF